MKKALTLFMACSHSYADDDQWAFCANVHDEVQIEADSYDCASLLGTVFAECIRDAGTHFNLRCPLAGDRKVGSSWAETH